MSRQWVTSVGHVRVSLNNKLALLFNVFPDNGHDFAYCSILLKQSEKLKLRNVRMKVVLQKLQIIIRVRIAVLQYVKIMGDQL